MHPDYVRGSRERAVFEALLAHLVDLRGEKAIWIATPGEVDRWWRQRAEMKVVKGDLGWRVEGPGSERARVAYISEEHGRITYRSSREPVSSSADLPVKDASRRDPVFR